MPKNSTRTRMDYQRKDHIDRKRRKQRNRHKQLQTHNLPTNDVENINSTNKRRNFLLAKKPRFVSCQTERMLQRIQRHSRITLRRLTHSKWEQGQTEKSSDGLDWLQKGIRYGSAWLCNKQPQNEEISHEVINFIDNHENLESGIDSRKMKLSWSRDSKRYFSRGCSIILNIHNCHVPLNHILRKYRTVYKLSWLQEIIYHLIYMDDIKLFVKNEKKMENLIHGVRI